MADRPTRSDLTRAAVIRERSGRKIAGQVARMSDDWEPWIYHDGRGCPVEGRYGQIETGRGEIVETVFGSWHGPADGLPIDAWDWSCAALITVAWDARVVRYRMLRPDSNELLTELAHLRDRVAEDA